MDNGGNQRDLTVNLKLTAASSNQTLAKSIASAVTDLQSQIVKAETAASMATKERASLQAQTAQTIAQSLREERASRIELAKTAANGAAEFQNLGDTLRANAKDFNGFSAASNAVTLSLSEIRDEQEQLSNTAAGMTNKVQGKIIAGFGLNEDSLRERAAKLVDQHWQEIMALSRFLLAKQELPGEVADIFCDTFLSRNPIHQMVLYCNPVLVGAEEYFD